MTVDKPDNPVTMKALLGIFITVSLFGASLSNSDDANHTTWELDATVNPVFRLVDRDRVSRILETGASYTVQWRTRSVTDQRRTDNREIQAEREWLWRWDFEFPRNIFRNGFLPRVSVEEMLCEDAAGRHTSTNLRSYVASNIDSVFVSTTRGRWAPRSRARAFRYDIFAPGGIDVNPTLGPHNYENQMEIAFVGGIRTEYIYGATEYDANNRQIRYHINPSYQGPADPLASRHNRCNLPKESYDKMRRLRATNYCEAFRPTGEKTSDKLMRSRPGLTLKPRSDCPDNSPTTRQPTRSTGCNCAGWKILGHLLAGIFVQGLAF